MALLSSPANLHGALTPSSSGSKRRRRTSPEALALLESAFADNPLPSKEVRNQLSDRIRWDGRAVQVWFQNRRQREKRDRETEAYYARVTGKENDAPVFGDQQQDSAAGPARTSQRLTSPLLRAVPQPYNMRSSAGLGHATELWRLMVSSPERPADALSSSPVKADVRPTSMLKRTMSLDVMASRPQQVFGHLAGGDRSSNVPSLSYSMAGDSSDGGSDTDELVTPDTSTFGADVKVELDEQDRECANLLMQLFAARA